MFPDVPIFCFLGLGFGFAMYGTFMFVKKIWFLNAYFKSMTYNPQAKSKLISAFVQTVS